jgi:hypothetical protein
MVNHVLVSQLVVGYWWLFPISGNDHLCTVLPQNRQPVAAGLVPVIIVSYKG